MRKFNHEAHKEMWLWLAENPECEKWEWPELKKIRKRPACFCFACEAAEHDKAETNMVCAKCPLIWPGNYILKEDGAICFQSIFGKWQKGHSPYLARKIANLPLREGVQVYKPRKKRSNAEED